MVAAVAAVSVAVEAFVVIFITIIIIIIIIPTAEVAPRALKNDESCLDPHTPKSSCQKLRSVRKISLYLPFTKYVSVQNAQTMTRICGMKALMICLLLDA